MRIGGMLLGVLGLASVEQGARAQSLEDRPVGIFLGYTFADVASPDPGGGRLHNQGLDFGVYVRQNHWLRWRVMLPPPGSWAMGTITSWVGRSLQSTWGERCCSPTRCSAAAPCRADYSVPRGAVSRWRSAVESI